MPNHCYQTVDIEGPTGLVKNLYRSLKDEGRFCDAIIPMPLSESGDWYEWHCKQWGTKWDVVEPEVISASWPDGVRGYKEKERSSFKFRCWTAWGPPTPVWDALLKLGFTVSADYIDECGNFEGTYKDGVTDEWIPEYLGTCGDCEEQGEKGTTCRSCGRGICE